MTAQDETGAARPALESAALREKRHCPCVVRRLPLIAPESGALWASPRGPRPVGDSGAPGESGA